MDFEKYLEEDSFNESLKKDLQNLNKQDYTMLRDAYYKVSDGMSQIDDSFKNISMSLGMSGISSGELEKEYKLFKKIELMLKQSQFGKIL